MNVLVTGAHGQLGRSLQALAGDYTEWSFAWTDVNDLDITDPGRLNDYFSQNHTDYVVNCAAYTAVDQAESDQEGALQINGRAPGLLAECAEQFGFVLIHVSTDYVFSGKKYTPYTEDDLPAPESIYGKTKLEGERAVLNNSKRAIVMRTSWLYSEYGSNFVKTIRRLAMEKEQLNIVSDQIGTPTYATDLAKAVLELIRSRTVGPELFHFSNEGVASWFDFSHEIVQLSGLSCRLSPIATSEYPLPAPRPFYSLMSKAKFRRQFNYSIPHWKDSLKVCIRNLTG